MMGSLNFLLLVSAAGLLVVSVMILRVTARGHALLLRVLSGIRNVLRFIELSVEPARIPKEANYVVVPMVSPRAYDGESFIASLGVASTSREPFPGLPVLEIQPITHPNATFAVDLNAPSFDKDPSEAVMIGPVAANGHAIGRWVLHAKASGNQALLFKICYSDRLVGEYETSIRVTKAFGMTANQMFAIGSALGLLSGLLAAMATLKALLSE